MVEMLKQVVLGCIAPDFRNGWIIEIVHEKESVYLASILVTDSSVEASGRAELMISGIPFQSLCPHKFHCAQAVLGLKQCMSLGYV